MTILILLKGQPGVGKTTLAKKLQIALGWEYIARDDIKEELVQLGTAGSEIGKKSYEILWQALEEKLAQSKSIISDTNLNQPVALEHVEKIVTKTRAKVIILTVTANKDVHKKRLESRKDQGLSDFWIDSWEKYQAYLKSEHNRGDFEMPYPTLHVDTSSGVDIHGLVLQLRRL